jgi:hypothetical protein
VPVKEIEGKNFDMSINRYMVAKHEDVADEPPPVVLGKLRALEAESAKDLDELEGML